MTFRPGTKLDPSQVRDLRFDRERGLGLKKQRPALRKPGRRAVPPMGALKRRAS